MCQFQFVMNILLLYGYVFGWIQRHIDICFNTLSGAHGVIYIYIYIYIHISNNGHHLPLALGLTIMAKQFEYHNATKLGWGILVSICPPVSSTMLTGSISFYTTYQPNSENVSPETCNLNRKKRTFGKFFKFVALTSCFHLGSNTNR